MFMDVLAFSKNFGGKKKKKKNKIFNKNESLIRNRLVMFSSRVFAKCSLLHLSLLWT